MLYRCHGDKFQPSSLVGFLPFASATLLLNCNRLKKQIGFIFIFFKVNLYYNFFLFQEGGAFAICYCLNYIRQFLFIVSMHAACRSGRL